MYSQAHVSSQVLGASVALRDRWSLKRRRREAEGPQFGMVVPCGYELRAERWAPRGAPPSGLGGARSPQAN